jgi:hypothetical protein
VLTPSRRGANTVAAFVIATEEMFVRPVSCSSCGSSVLVKKHSLAHTLVQWTTGTEQCVELSLDMDRGIVPTCTRLRDSIEDSVRLGVIPVRGF